MNSESVPESLVLHQTTSQQLWSVQVLKSKPVEASLHLQLISLRPAGAHVLVYCPGREHWSFPPQSYMFFCLYVYVALYCQHHHNRTRTTCLWMNTFFSGGGGDLNQSSKTIKSIMLLRNFWIKVVLTSHYVFVSIRHKYGC